MRDSAVIPEFGCGPTPSPPAAAGSPDLAPLPRRLALLSAAVFLIGAPFAAFVGLAPRIQTEWHVGGSGAAALYSAYVLGSALAALLVLPRLRASSPRVLLTAMLLVAVAHPLFAMAPGPLSGGVARLAGGGAYLVAYYGAVQWVADVTPARRRGAAIGALVAAGYGGTSASYLLVTTVLGGDLTWREAYALLSLPGLAGVAAAWYAFRGLASSPAAADSLATETPRLSLRGFDRSLWRTIAGYAAHAGELYIARLWLPYALLSKLGAGAADSASGGGAWLLAGLIFAAGVPSPFFGGWLADRVGVGRAAGWVLFGGAALALILPWIGSVPVFVALCFVYGILLPADSAVLTSGVTHAAPRGRLGEAQAVQAIVGFTAGAVMPAIVGLLAEHAHAIPAWRVALGVNAMLALGGAWAMHALSREPRTAAYDSDPADPGLLRIRSPRPREGESGEGTR